MNGAHDLGGMDGFALPVRDPNEPTFKSAWERLVFGAHLAMKKPWNIDESRFGVESLPPDVYLSTSYYARWLLRNERLLIKYGLVTAQELADPESVKEGAQARGADSYSTLTEDLGDVDDSTEAAPARFRVGDQVQVKNEHPHGHTRAPRYARGHVGTVHRDQGVHIFPDTHAMGLGPKPQHCYCVAFAAQELWGSRASAKDSVYIDLFDDYLEAVQ